MREHWSCSPAGRCFRSLAEVFAALRPRIRPELATDAGFRRLQEASAAVPASAANHEFFLELRPGNLERMDFGFCLPPGGIAAGEIGQWRDGGAPGPVTERFLHAKGPTCLLWFMMDTDSRIVGCARGVSCPGGFRDGRVAAELLAGLTAETDAAVRRDWHFAARLMHGFAGPVLHAGRYAHRREDGLPIRLVARLYDAAADAARRLDWPGDAGELAQLTEDWPFDDFVSLSMDFTAGGPLCRLGVEILRPGSWTEMNPALWAERLRFAAAAGFCTPAQAEALVSVIGSHVVETAAGPTAANIGINHVKFVFGDGPPTIKFYLAGNMGQIRSAS